jgi:hypothetical protein
MHNVVHNTLSAVQEWFTGQAFKERQALRCREGGEEVDERKRVEPFVWTDEQGAAVIDNATLTESHGADHIVPRGYSLRSLSPYG